MTGFPLIDDVPDIERQAMRLDGDAYALAGAHVPIGLPEDPVVRAAAALAGRPARLVAARGTAAWIWGALPDPPRRGEFLVDLAARWRPPASDAIDVVESVVRAGDAVRLGTATVTTPLRTALDLARFRTVFSAGEADAVRALAALGGFGLPEAVRAMDRGRNLAGKRRARERLESALSPS